MARDKDKGLVGGAADVVGGATDSLKETTGALGGGGAVALPQLRGLPQ